MGEHEGPGYTQYGDQPAARGYLAQPARGTGPGVLVLHAWWGLNDTIRAICDRLAGAGFVALAPDLYHGAVASTIADAETLAQALFKERLRASAEVIDATRFLGERAEGADRGLAVLGFSLGASYALDLAAAAPAQIGKVVIYYGTGGDDFGDARAAFLGHFAADDPYEPRAYVDQVEEAIRRAGRPVTFHHYPGTGHWFAEPDRTDAYDEAAATLAWERTLDFLGDGPGAAAR